MTLATSTIGASIWTASHRARRSSSTRQPRSQKFSAIGFEDDGGHTLVWSGDHSSDNEGVFVKLYDGFANEKPTITLPGAAVNYAESDPATILDAGATVSDIDSPDFDGGALTVEFSLGGTINDRLEIRDEGTGPGQIGISGSNVTYGGITIGTFTGGTDGMTPLVVSLNAMADAATTQALARNITYRNVSEGPATDARNVRMYVADGDGGVSLVAIKGINVSIVNDAPVISGPASESVTEGNSLRFEAPGNPITISDPDIGTDELKVTLTVDQGLLKLGSTNNLTFLVGDGNNDPVMVFTGMQADVNNALDGTDFIPDNWFVGTANLTIDVDDQGSTGSGGPQVDTVVIPITVNSDGTNDAPNIVKPGDQNTPEDQPLFFSVNNANQIQLEDDAGPNPVEITLNITDGTLTLSSTTGLSFTTGDGTADTTMVFTGTIEDSNAALEGMYYQPDLAFVGTATLDIDVSDLGNTDGSPASPELDSASLNIDVDVRNRAPVVSSPASVSTMEETPLIFSGGDLISFSDIDAGTQDLEVTLTVSHGDLTLSTTAGLTFTVGDGTNDATMTFKGTLTEINPAVDSMTFTPQVGYAGAALLQVSVNDLGNTGEGGALVDQETVDIDITPDGSNDPPVNTVPGTQATSEEIPLVFSDTGGNQISINDDTGPGNVTVTLTATDGIVSLSNTAGGEFLVNTDISGDQDDVQTAMAPDGRFVMVWTSAGQDGSGDGIYAQLYDTSGAPIGGEFRVNTTTASNQHELAIAIDDSGNFVVVWTSDNQDGNSKGVIAQRFDATGAKLGGEFLVNTETAHEQRNASVAMDADGDFIIVWQSKQQDDPGDNWGVYGTRFDSAGNALDVPGGPLGVKEFLVNTETNNHQENPVVAMDNAGNFTIAWQSKDQDGDDYGVYAKRYDAAGNALDSPLTPPSTPEFQVNTVFFKDQQAPTIAMDDDGDFVIAWQSEKQDHPSGDPAWGVYAQRFDSGGNLQGVNFLVNAKITDRQSEPTVAMAGNGDFVVAWQAKKQDNPDNKEGVYAQRYDSAGTAVGGEFLVNSTTVKEQQAPAIAMGDNGRFVVGWQSKSQDQGDSWGVYAQRYKDIQSLTFLVGDGVDDAVVQFQGTVDQINDALNGLVFKPDPDFVGTANLNILTDDGSLTDSDNVAITVNPLNDAPTVSAPASESVSEGGSLVFSTGGGNQITIGDVDITSEAVEVTLLATQGTMTLSGTTGLVFLTGDGTDDAEMTFTGSLTDINTALEGTSFNAPVGFTGGGSLQVNVDDQGNVGSGPALSASATVQITFNADAVNDAPIVQTPPPQQTAVDTPLVLDVASGNAPVIIDDSGSNPVEVTMTVANGKVSLSQLVSEEFQVNSYTTDNQQQATVATAPTGEYVVVWQSENQDGSGFGIYAQRYNAVGQPAGSEIQVHSTTAGDQELPVVAVNASGQFAVAWQSAGQDGSGDGIYARVFDATGAPISNETLVNSYTENNQQSPRIAMDDAGNFIVVWESAGQDGGGLGIYAQRLDSDGVAIGSEFQVNTTTASDQREAAVAMDADGDFVIVWRSKDPSSDGIFGQRYDSNGDAVGGEFLINTVVADAQTVPDVAMDDAGNFVVVWQSNNEDGDGQGIYGRRYDNTGFPQGGNFRIHTTTAGNQTLPSVSMNGAGEFFVSWEHTDGSGKGIYGQRFNAAGDAIGEELRLNTQTASDQELPSVAMADNGNVVTVWTSGGNQDGDGDGIFGQRLADFGGLSFTSGDGINDSLMVFAGTVADINDAISGMTFTPTTSFTGVATINLVVDDQGNSGSGGPRVSSKTTYIIVGGAGLIVDTTSDVVDGNTGSITNLNGNKGADGKISLREAIEAANNTTNGATPDVILFDIPNNDTNHVYYSDDGVPDSLTTVTATTLADEDILDFDPDYPYTPHSWFSIDLNNASPQLEITDAVIIDGYSQAGASVNTLSVGHNASLKIELTSTGADGNRGLTVMDGGDGTTIRGLAINGFDNAEILTESGADGVTIQGNFLGTDITGTIGQGDGDAGVHLRSSNNLVGGASVADRNIASGNNSRGVTTFTSGPIETGNVVQNNYIGTDATGLNPVANGAAGIQVYNQDGLLIVDNVISGNTGDGIWLRNSTTVTNTIIQGNLIGVTADGVSPIANSGAGIWIEEAATNTTIGGLLPGEANTIAFNTADGIAVDAGTGTTIRGNAIYSNDELGIDLIGVNGVNANDAGDGDTGPNNLQNFPVVASALTSGSDLVVVGTFNSTSSTSFFIDFFASTSADASGHGEAERYLASATIVTNGSGDATISELLTGVGVVVGEFITATATDPSGNTSEFALSVPATLGNSAPTITNLAGDTLGYNEDDPATVIEQGVDVTVVDGDSPDFDTGNLTVSVFAGGDISEDVLSIRDQGPGLGNISVTGANVFYDFGGGPLLIGAFAGGSGGADLVVTFNATANAVAADALIENITYLNTDTVDPTNTARTIRYTLDDGDGGVSATHDATVTVADSNDDPTADATAGQPYVINEGDSVSLDASSSTDVDGTIVSYEWDLDNDSIFGELGESTGVNPLVSWATLQSFGVDDDGLPYTIGLRVTDDLGGSSTTTTTLTVNNTAPTLTTTGAATIGDGGLYTLNLSASDPGNEMITSWTINWGDGTIDTIAGNPPSTTHTYNGVGFTYNILASATDEDGTYLQNELLVASSQTDSIMKYGTDGGFLLEFGLPPDPETPNYPVDAIIGPDGNLYVSGWISDDVLRYNPTTGAFIDEFVAAGSGGLDSAAGLAFGPDGHLYVASRLTSEVLRYQGPGAASPGAFIDVFADVGPIAIGVEEPEGLVFGPDGHLYVSDFTLDAVYKFDGITGAPILTTGHPLGEFVAPNAGGLNAAEDLVFGSDGNLYVANDNGNNVLRYNGMTGAFIDEFVAAGDGGLMFAQGLRFGPDGNFYVGSWGSDRVLRYQGLDGVSPGAFIDEYAGAGSGLAETTYFDFIPGHQVTVISNNPPVITNLAGDTLNYTEDDAATVIEQGVDVTVTDGDSTDFDTGNLTVSVFAGGDATEDVLSIRDQGPGVGNISVAGANVSYDFGVGPTLIGTFTGGSGGADLVVTFNASANGVAADALIENITYQNTDTTAPTTTPRTLRYTLDDGDGGLSAAHDATVTVTAQNDASVLAAIEGAPLAYLENAAPAAITAAITIADVDDTNIESATIQITGNYASGEDVLAFTDTASITGSWNTITGTMTLAGSDSLANYEAALRAVTYRNTSNNPNTLTRTVSFTVDDGDDSSNTLTRDIDITSVNDPPVLSAIEAAVLPYTEGDGPVSMTSTILLGDLDDSMLEDATIQITGNYALGQDVLSFADTPSITGSWNAISGTMTLTGSDTLANYEAALRTVTYQNTSDNPSTLTRTVSFTTNDGDDPSNTVTRDINVTAMNDASVLAAIEGAPLAYLENAVPTAITAAITVADVDDTNIETATIQITGNYASGQDVLAFTDTASITGSWNAVSGTMTLSGSDTLANYEAALRAVTYQNTSDNPSTLTRTVSFTTNDGDDPSNIVTRDINVTAMNDASVLAAIEGAPLAYLENAAPAAITGSITVADVDDTNIESATIQITGNYTSGEDVLAFTDTASITGSWNAISGAMTLSGSDTLANYEAALRAVTYENTSSNPSTAQRTVSFTVDDGDDPSNTITRDINVTAVEDLKSTDESLANTETGDTQVTSSENRGSHRAVAVAPSGDSVVVWSSQNQDASGWGVFAQRYDKNGIALGGEFRINVSEGNNEQWASVATTDSGNFVVAWTADVQDGSGQGVFARLFNATGTPLTGDILVNTTTSNNQKTPSVDMDAAGNFVVAWEGEGVGDGTGIFARRFDSTGVALDPTEIRANNVTAGTQSDTSIAVDASGNFVVVWDDANGVHARQFDSAGTPLAGQFTVDNGGSAGEASVAVDADGDFTVVWRETFIDKGVYLRRYDATGTPLAPTAIVNTTSFGDQTDPSVAMDGAGNFIVTWEGIGLGDGAGVFAQRYDSSGMAVGGETLINQTITGVQDQTSVAILDLNNYIVVWSGEGPGDTDGVFARQFGTAPSNTPPTVVNLGGDMLAYNEGDGAVAIEQGGDALVADVDSPDFDTGNLTASITVGNDPAEDVLAIRDQGPGVGNISVTGSNVEYDFGGGPVVIGSFVGGAGGADLIVTLNASATPMAVTALANNITYENTDTANPTTGTRTVQFTVDDGDGGTSLSHNATVSVSGVNDASALSGIEAGSLGYNENDGSVSITGSLVVADVDDLNIESAVIQITGNYASGQDVLAFADTPSITGVWNAVSGTMTLTGSDTLANYEAALRAVTYQNTSDNPSTLTRTVSFTANDGDDPSNTVTRDIDVTSVNDPSVLSGIEAAPFAYTEGDGLVAITSTTLIGDLDDSMIEGATIQITGNYALGQDLLSFTDTPLIIGTWTAASGTLTLSGSDSLTNYRIALTNVRFENTSDAPSTLPRTVSFTVDDGDDPSNTVTRDINITAVNDVPSLAAIEGVPLAYTENASPIAITSSLTIADVDDTNIEGATIQITGNYASGQDVLAFTDTPSITGVWNAISGTMTLTGSDTLANYEAALRAVTYQNTSDNPSTLTRTVSFTTNDGDDPSNTVTRDIDVTATNDTSIVAAIEGVPLAYTENAAPTAITSSLTIADVDDTNIESAAIQITGNYASGQDLLAFTDTPSITGVWDAISGTMTLTGSDTLANYEAALRAVTYQNTSDNPSTLARTVSFTTNDGDDPSNTVTRDIDVTATNDASVLATIEGAPLAYLENAAPTAITSSLTIADVDDTNIESATIQITGNYASGEDVLAFVDTVNITSSWNSGTGALILAGTDTLAAYEAALRAVMYANASEDPSTLTRTVSFTTNDGDDPSNIVTRDINLTAQNDASSLSGIEGVPLVYPEDAGHRAVTASLLLSDIDDVNLESASVQITAGYLSSEDTLAFVDTPAITGSWNAATGTLTLSGSDTVANYEAALRSVTYENTSQDPSATARTVSFRVNDGDAPSNIATRDINVSPINDPALLGAIEVAPLPYDEGDAPTAITAGISVTDVDDTHIESATIQITGNYNSGEDVLAFVDTPSITGSWDPGSGTLTLTGSDSLANYDAALRSATYENTSATPSTATRTVSFRVHDGDAPSNVIARNITVTAANGVPVGLADAYSVDAGETLTISLPSEGVLANDSDPESQPLSATVSTAPLKGTLTLQADGTFVYTPDPGEFGTDEFFYVADDGTDSSPPTRVEITILSAPAPPDPDPTPDPEPEEEEETEEEEESTDSGPTGVPPDEGTDPGELGKRRKGNLAPGDSLLEEELIVQPTPGAPAITAQELLVAGFRESAVSAGTETDERAAQETDNSPEAISESVNTITRYISPELEFVTRGGSFWRELDTFDEQVEEDIYIDSSQIALTSSTGAAVMAGYVMWVMRGGILIAALAAQMPAWSMLSPLPIFIGDGDEEEGEDLVSMLQESNEESSPDEPTRPELADHAV